MRKCTLALLLALTATTLAFAQKASIRGTITDSYSKENLSNAVISMLRAKDSVLYKFARSNSKGQFTIGQLPAGKFILLVTYPKYADYVDQVTFGDTSEIDLGKVNITLKAKLLEEVVVRQKISSIKLKGDTTEYTADSFHVQPNATVEDLLKKLPGIQVDKDGKITAQGEKVQKVLVDGEEFFGDDPTLVTQNLRADMVDKVQVFDKKSDQAAFTGIDDGVKSKTINLKLKDNKKNGYFGKINAGAGTEGYYDNQVMINMFKKKKKISAYGIASNTGKTGLNWQERNNYGQSIAGSVDYDETNDYYIFTGGDDDLDNWTGQYNGQGFPVVKTGGIHYNDKWNDEKQSLNLNYKILQLNVEGTNTTNSQFILPDTLYYNNQQQNFSNQILRNRLDGNYEYTFDSTSTVKLTADGGTDHKITNNHFISEALAIDSALVNRSKRDIATIGDMRTLNSNLLWRKKLLKKGRTISINFKEAFKSSSTEGYLNADNSFYKNGNVANQQVIDQYKRNNNQDVVLDAKITFSEPLSPVSSLIANYGISINNSTSNRSSFNKAPTGKYSVLDSLYSNDYTFNVFTQRGGLVYNLVKKKFRFNAGANIGLTGFDQKDMHADTSNRRSFTNWFPQASMAYAFSSQKRLSFRYNGYTSQPSIQQIQPTRTNDDPLNISIGNPDLKPQFNNNLSLYFNDYKVLTNRYIFTNISYSFISNAISSNNTVDSNGKRVYQSVNVDGERNVNFYFDYGFKWKKPNIEVGFYSNANQSRNISIVNKVLNTTNSGNYTFGTNLNKSKEKKYGIGIRSSATYTQSNSSVQKNITTHYWTFTIRPDVDVYLPLKFQLHSDCEFNFRQKTSAFDNNTNVILLNAWVGKKFLKNDVLLLKASANDLLNQNIGFSRTVNSNFISQNTYSTIQRFFMLSVVWNFNKAGSPAPQQ